MSEQKFYLAEKAVIGCLLTSIDCMEDVIGELIADDFNHPFFRKTFNVILSMFKKDSKVPIDLITVHTEMKNDYDESDGELFTKLADIANDSFSPANINQYVKIVKDESLKRKTKKLIDNINHKINNNEEDYLDHLHKGINNIENDISVVIKPYHEILFTVIDKLDRESKAGNLLSGLSTGFDELDNYTNGLQNGDLIILAARPSQGKSLLMNNIADNMGCRQNLPVIVFSLEMPESQLCKRSLARESRINAETIFFNKIKEHHWKNLTPAINKLSESKVFINDMSKISCHQIRSYARKIRNEHGLKAIFIDYIGLMDGEGENETLRLGNISAGLKSIAKDFYIPVFALSQLNRNIESRPDKKPLLSDIRQSGSIEQDADIILFLHKEEEKSKTATLTIAKHRNGRTGKIELIFDHDYLQFIGYDKK